MSEALKAGPELDALVTEALGLCAHRTLVERESHVFEYDWWFECANCHKTGSDRGSLAPTQFSTSISNAFIVVEAMRAKGWTITLSNDTPDGDWFCEIVGPNTGDQAQWSRGDEADTLPLAICLAALKALEADAPQSAVPTPSLTLPPSEPRPND